MRTQKHRVAKRLGLAFALLAGAESMPFVTSAHAATCALDESPGATLLLPYFELDAGNPNGRTTLFSIANAGPAGTLAHVVLWTDAGVPTLTFDVYLTGYDVQTINLRDVFNGTLPQTADAGGDPGDAISPVGPYSQDVTFSSCRGALPPPPLQPIAIDALRRAHTGLPSATDTTTCSGIAHGDNIARGYVTVDAARKCSLLHPGDAGYFGPDGVASAANVLWGDFFYITPGSLQAAQAQNLVRLESDPAAFAGKPTFYSTAVGATGADGREPLPTTWAVRYIAGGAFHGTTDLISWRDIRATGAGQPFGCTRQPAWYPQVQNSVVIFDEQENTELPFICPLGCTSQTNLLVGPAVASRVRVGSADLPVPFDFGWMFLDLNTTFGANIVVQPSWVGTVTSEQGLFSVGLAGTSLDDPCAPNGTGSIDPGL